MSDLIARPTSWINRIWRKTFRERIALSAFLTLILVAALGIAIMWWSHTPDQQNPVLRIFSLLLENLSLTLPVLSACLSIMLSIRELLKPHGWRRLPLPLTLGLVSFSIWYVVSAQSTPDDYIRIGVKHVLYKHFAVILVITAFIWAAFCALCLVLAESIEEAKRGWLWHLGQMSLVALSLAGLLVPFFLFEDKAAVEARIRQSLDERLFSVSIAWKDPSLYSVLGSRADDIIFCKVLGQVSARTVSEALRKAREEFMQSPQSRQQFGKNPPFEAKVKLVDGWMVAEVDAGAKR